MEGNLLTLQRVIKGESDETLLHFAARFRELADGEGDPFGRLQAAKAYEIVNDELFERTADAITELDNETLLEALFYQQAKD